VTAIVLVALGLALLGSAGLVTGGVPGLAFLLHYASGMPLGVALLVVNLPFALLAWRALGPGFTVRTLVAMGALSAGVEATRWALQVHAASPWFAAVAGGLLIGVGLLVLLRHGASLGGVGVLAIVLQRRHGWSVGRTQMLVDALIVAAAFAVVEPGRVLASVAGSLALNAVLAWNHRPGRYAVGLGYRS